MSINVSNEAEVNLLNILRAAVEAGNVHLFSNDLTPDADTVIGSFTESAAAGYSAQSAGTWSAAATDGSGVAFIDSALFEFTSTEDPAVEVYGWYVTDGSGNYLFGNRFGDAPRSFGVADAIQFSIRLQLRERAA